MRLRSACIPRARPQASDPPGVSSPWSHPLGRSPAVRVAPRWRLTHLGSFARAPGHNPACATGRISADAPPIATRRRSDRVSGVPPQRTHCTWGRTGTKEAASATPRSGTARSRRPRPSPAIAGSEFAKCSLHRTAPLPDHRVRSAVATRSPPHVIPARSRLSHLLRNVHGVVHSVVG